MRRQRGAGERHGNSRRDSAVGFRHTVADADFRKEIFRLGGVFLDFAADVGHIDPENLIVAAGPGAPELLDDVIIGQNPTGVLAQKGHDAELAEGQFGVFTPDEHLMLIIVNGQFAYGIGALLGDFAVAGGGAGMADGCPHPGQKLRSVPKGLVR